MSSIGDPTRIGVLLDDIISQKNWRRRMGLHQVFSFWADIVEKDVERISRPSLIRGSVLWVNVADSSWMQQLHYMKTELIDRINARLTNEEITDIRFQLDTSLGQMKQQNFSDNQKEPINIDPRKIREFETMISSLKDEELRRTMARVWWKYQKRKDRR